MLENLALIGDATGSVALFAMIYTIYIQRKELGLQRDELALQRKEMSLQREEMAKSNDSQNELISIQRGQFSAAIASIKASGILASVESAKITAQINSMTSSTDYELISKNATIVTTMSKELLAMAGTLNFNHAEALGVKPKMQSKE